MKRALLARSAIALTLVLVAAGCGGGGGDGGGGGSSDGGHALPDGHRVLPDGCVPTFEICGDRIDQNCDGHDESCGNTDNDAFEACRPGQAPPDCDCDDTDPTIYPGAPETCNGIDDDCDGQIDEVASCCSACAGMVDQADTCTPAGACVCSTQGAGDAPCPAGQTCCSSGCVDTQTDFNNCGLCEAACTNQADRCTAGTCQCGTGPACSYINMCVSGSCGG